MSNIALLANTSGTGTFTIAAPNSSTDRRLTLPDTSGTLVTGDDIAINGITSDYTSGTALNVDSNGIVTKPNQPAFMGYKNTDTGTQGGTTEILLVCNQAIVNKGSHYNTSTGLFTCPVAGVYQVSYFGMSTAASGDGVFYSNRARPYKNGSGYSVFAYAYGDGYRNIAGTWLVNCSANDTLGVNAADSLASYHEVVIFLIG